jgi:nicotinamidase-related amidase
MKKAYGVSIPQTLEEVCDPERVALLVYDMQVGILSQIKNAADVMQHVLKVLTAARNARVRVFFSRHLSLPKELMSTISVRYVTDLLACSNEIARRIFQQGVRSAWLVALLN